MATKHQNSFSDKFYQRSDRFLFSWSYKIRKSNVAVVKYFFYFFFVQVLIYSFFFWQSKSYPVAWGISIWTPEVALPTILTITGVLFTIIVLFSINPRGTQFGNEFIIILIDEINSLKKDDEITIISPNINIGTTTYKLLLENLISAIKSAHQKEAKIIFKSFSLKKEYLDAFPIDKGIADITAFYQAGKDNGSEMLTFLYNSYDKKGEEKENYIKTITDLKLLLSCITIISPKTDILTQKIVGFLSNNKFFIGKYYPDNSNEKNITVRGEIIDTTETVQMLKEHFIKDL